MLWPHEPGIAVNGQSGCLIGDPGETGLSSAGPAVEVDLWKAHR